MCVTFYHKVPNCLWLLYIIYNYVHVHILCVFDILPQGAYYIQYIIYTLYTYYIQYIFLKLSAQP